MCIELNNLTVMKYVIMLLFYHHKVHITVHKLQQQKRYKFQNHGFEINSLENIFTTSKIHKPEISTKSSVWIKM